MNKEKFAHLRDNRSTGDYRDNLEQGWEAQRYVIDMFRKNGISAGQELDAVDSDYRMLMEDEVDKIASGSDVWVSMNGVTWHVDTAHSVVWVARLTMVNEEPTNILSMFIKKNKWKVVENGEVDALLYIVASRDLSSIEDVFVLKAKNRYSLLDCPTGEQYKGKDGYYFDHASLADVPHFKSMQAFIDAFKAGQVR